MSAIVWTDPGGVGGLPGTLAKGQGFFLLVLCDKNFWAFLQILAQKVPQNYILADFWGQKFPRSAGKNGHPDRAAVQQPPPCPALFNSPSLPTDSPPAGTEGRSDPPPTRLYVVPCGEPIG